MTFSKEVEGSGRSKDRQNVLNLPYLEGVDYASRLHVRHRATIKEDRSWKTIAHTLVWMFTRR